MSMTLKLRPKDEEEAIPGKVLQAEDTARAKALRQREVGWV